MHTPAASVCFKDTLCVTVKIDPQTGSRPFFPLLSHQNICILTMLEKENGVKCILILKLMTLDLHRAWGSHANDQPVRCDSYIRTFHLMTHIGRVSASLHNLLYRSVVLCNDYQPVIDDHADFVNVFSLCLRRYTGLRDRQESKTERESSSSVVFTVCKHTWLNLAVMM